MSVVLYNVTTAIKFGGIETAFWQIAKILDKDAIIYSGRGDFIPEFYKTSSIKLKMFNYLKSIYPNLGTRFKKFATRFSFFLNSKNSLKSENFDTFVILKPFDFFVCRFVKKINPNIKTIFISGGEDFYFFDKFFIRYVDKIISVSKENAKILKNRYKNREIIVIPNGVDKEIFKEDSVARKIIRNKFNIKNDEILFICISRLVGWKGLDLAIKAIKDFKNSKLMIIGDGEEFNNLKKLANSLKLDVIFLKNIAHKDIVKFLNASDIFIQPSRGHEAFGIVVVEALACNKICVVSNNGGMKDIIENGVNGFKFEINDLDDLKLKLNLALSNKDKIFPRKSINNKFNWSDFVKEFNR